MGFGGGSEDFGQRLRGLMGGWGACWGLGGWLVIEGLVGVGKK